MLQSMGLQAVGHNWATEQQDVLPEKGGAAGLGGQLIVTQRCFRVVYQLAAEFAHFEGLLAACKRSSQH